MCNNSHILIFICIVFLIQACRSKFANSQGDVTQIKLEIPEDIRMNLNDLSIQDLLIIYYHSGDCSICYGHLMKIYGEFDNILVLSISSSKNSALVDYYMQEIGFMGGSFIDSSDYFYLNNKPVLELHKLFLLDEKYNVLEMGEYPDEETIYRFRQTIHKIK